MTEFILVKNKGRCWTCAQNLFADPESEDGRRWRKEGIPDGLFWKCDESCKEPGQVSVRVEAAT